jgi:hypothetical protein
MLLLKLCTVGERQGFVREATERLSETAGRPL